MSSIAQLVEKRQANAVPRQEKHWLAKIIDKKTAKPEKAAGGMRGRFSPSSMSNPCDRYLWLHYYGRMVTEAQTAQQHRTLEHGNVSQHRWKEDFKTAGLYVADEVVCENMYPPIRGRADYILKYLPEYPKYVIELKTINVRGWDTVQQAAKREHEVQLQIYLNMLNIPVGSVLYENKDTFEFLLHEYQKDEQLWQELLERCVRVQQMRRPPTIDEVAHLHDTRYCKCLLVRE